jgi:hypothetical protein
MSVDGLSAEHSMDRVMADVENGNAAYALDAVFV